MKISPTWKGNSQSSPKGTKSPIQVKLKEKHAKTHGNQTSKDWAQRKNIKCTKGGATSNIQQKPHTLTADLSAETAGQKEIAGYI